jgi:uncharacterized membrane protein
MSLKQLFLLYLVTLVVFFLIDMVWLGAVAKGFYRKHLGAVMSEKIVWPAAILFYLLFIAGLLVFAVRPGLAAGGPVRALLFGALFGLIAYATYDLTNLATMKGWPVVVTFVDLAWGTVLGGVVSFISASVARLLFKT